jgi:carboxylesterase type B
MKITLASTLALAALYHPTIVAAVDSCVHLDYSSYNGVALPNGVTQWLGIRYAAPPLGDLRFAAPQDPPSTGDGIIEADTHGPVCLKRSSSNLPAKLETPDTNEDCLFMDIYAPTNAIWGSLPVMFFLQGGGFSILSNANYNGSGLVLASEMNMVSLNLYP